MGLPRTEVTEGLLTEIAAFESLMRSLSPEEWNAPTRCEGWTVADVCAHVTGTMTAIATGQLDSLGQPNGTQLQAEERRGRSAQKVADELRSSTEICAEIARSFDDQAWAGPPPVDVPGTLGEAVEALWYDTYVHAEDIRAATGRPSERGPGLRASVSHLSDLLTHREWGPATIALDGMEEFKVGDGSGRRVTGDPLAFVLAGTGRGDPAEVGLDGSVNVYADA